MELLDLYKKLLEEFGPQNWWPVRNNFRPSEWEVCLGTILTQNTAWKNVEKALANLKAEKILGPKNILELESSELERIIRPAGFYRQKAERLKIFAKFISGFKSFGEFSEKVTREQLLGMKGIGPETADSILLYACNRPFFVIDAYTKRIYSKFFGNEISDYSELQKIFQSSLPKDVEIYKEFHALIVEQAKRSCRKKPVCENCLLIKNCIHSELNEREK